MFDLSEYPVKHLFSTFVLLYLLMYKCPHKSFCKLLMDTILSSGNDPGLRLIPAHNVIVRIANKGIRMRNREPQRLKF